MSYVAVPGQGLDKPFSLTITISKSTNLQDGKHIDDENEERDDVAHALHPAQEP